MGFELVDVPKDDRLKSIKILEEYIRKLGEDWAYIYIGKTHVVGKKSTPFDKKNHKTWNLEAIKNRRRDHSKNKGLTNLTVISVITKADVPTHDHCLLSSIEHNSIEEQYALSLESEIIYRLRFSTFGARLINLTSNPGNVMKKDCNGGFVIYVAYGNSLNSASYTCTLPNTPCEVTSVSASSPLISPKGSSECVSFKFEDITPDNSPGSNTPNEATTTFFPLPVPSDYLKSQREEYLPRRITLERTCAGFTTNNSPLTHWETRQELTTIKSQQQTLKLRSTVTPDCAGFTMNTSELPQTGYIPAHNYSSRRSSSEHSRSKYHSQKYNKRTCAKERHTRTPYKHKMASKTLLVFYDMNTGCYTESYNGRSLNAYNIIRPLIKKLPQIHSDDWKDSWKIKLLGNKSGCPVRVDFHSEQTATEILKNHTLFSTQGIKVKPYFI